MLKGIQQEPTIFLFRMLWKFAKERRSYIVLYSIMFLIANLIILLPPIFFGQMVRELQESGISDANVKHLLLLLGYLFLCELVFWCFHGPARIIERSVAFKTSSNYRQYLLKGVLSLGLTWHGERDSGNTIDKINKATEGLTSFSENVFQIIQLLVRLFGTAAVLYWFSPEISIWVFLFVIVSFGIVLIFDKYLVPQYRRLNEYSNKIMASVFDALTNVTSIKILHIEAPILKGISEKINAPFLLYQQNSKLIEGKWFSGAIIFQGIAVVPIGFYLYHAFKTGQSVDAGTVSTLYLYLSNLIYVYYGFTSFYQSLILEKNQVLNAEIIEQSFLRDPHIRKASHKNWKNLSIQNLHFKYDEEGEHHLKNVSLNIAKGEKIAVIGESGSGKSTFLKVLHGLYPTAYAEVAVDENQLKNQSLADIDLKTMLVPQDPEIFSSTIRENITLGIECPESEIHHVMNIGNFASVVETLPKGLDSVVNEKGVNLSGGQRQRLALSRALLFSKDKEIILLDESTSSVDSENESEIYENIWNAFKGKTVIASIHKMNLLKFFDTILIFKNGTIVDRGTFDELLQNNTHFRKMWDQFIKATRE